MKTNGIHRRLGLAAQHLPDRDDDDPEEFDDLMPQSQAKFAKRIAAVKRLKAAVGELIGAVKQTAGEFSPADVAAFLDDTTRHFMGGAVVNRPTAGSVVECGRLVVRQPGRRAKIEMDVSPAGEAAIRVFDAKGNVRAVVKADALGGAGFETATPDGRCRARLITGNRDGDFALAVVNANGLASSVNMMAHVKHGAVADAHDCRQDCETECEFDQTAFLEDACA